MSQKIRVMLVDDHAIVRKGIAALLATEPDFEVVGEASDGAEAIAKAQALRPDVVMMDLVMPKIDGIEATRQITSQLKGVRVLVLTSFAADDKVFPAIKAGALGYLLKDSGPFELVQAIRQVHRGQPSLEPSIASKVLFELAHPVEGPADDRSADGARDGSAAARGAGAQQPGDRREARDYRADGEHAREQHPRQAAPGQPDAGRAICPARGAGVAGRHSFLWRRRVSFRTYRAR